MTMRNSLLGGGVRVRRGAGSGDKIGGGEADVKWLAPDC